MILTETEALTIVSLATMKSELRIPCGRSLARRADYRPASRGGELRGAINGPGAGRFAARCVPRSWHPFATNMTAYREITEDAAHNTWMDPYRSIAD